MPPPIEQFRSIAFGLDLGLSTKQRADYTALVIAGVDALDRRWILNAVRWRADWPTTFARVLSYNQTWKPGVIQTEQIAFQELAIREMVDAGLPVTTIHPHTDKEARFSVVHQRYALGLVWHNETLDAEYEGELLSFGADEGGHDDWVDATGLALMTLFKEIRGRVSDDASFYNWGSGKLGHEREMPKLDSQDGSYTQVTTGQDGEEQLATFDRDGSPFDDGDWHHEYIGDQVVIFEGGKETGRYPRWVLPQLLANRQREYQEKYGGRKTK